MSKKRIVIEGASGYSGMELTRLLARHPGIELVGVTSGRWAGKTVRDRIGLAGPVGELTYSKVVPDDVDAVLFATPADGSASLTTKWVERGAKIVDLSDHHRANPEWVYGLTEHAREALRGASHVANPGCYPTATQNALKPLIEAGFAAPGPVVVDAKSGVTGAGRRLTDTLLYNELADNHYPYKVGFHRHVPEIERGLGREVLFTPHLLPCRRGLLASCYLPVKDGTSHDDLINCLQERYANEPFVQVVEVGPEIGLLSVVGSPVVRVAVALTTKANVARVFGCLDNLMKGAASQAIQNLNLILGLEETAGLL
jgi:N-acetyl-gamma-glutamyl-phosphate reductase